MLVEDVLKLQSHDAKRTGRGYTVESIMDETYIDSDYYICVREEMRLAGINLVPVYVFNNTFKNGHHRVRIAMELGHEEVLVTDNILESGWSREEERTVVRYTGKERIP